MSKEIQKSLDALKNWNGSKKELVEKLEFFENEHQEFYMNSKKNKNAKLKVNIRRIQQFLDEKILPLSSGHNFNWDHILRYLAAIKYKNNGLLIRQISERLKSLSDDEILIFLSSSSKESISGPITSSSIRRKELRDLGREEGRVLKTLTLRLAITPWCHVHINSNQLSRLTEANCKTLADAFHSSLLENIKI